MINPTNPVPNTAKISASPSSGSFTRDVEAAALVGWLALGAGFCSLLLMAVGDDWAEAA